MSSATFTLESRELALTLHDFLNDLEPARWKAEKVAALEVRMTQIHTHLEELQAKTHLAADHHRQAIRLRLEELREALGEHVAAFVSSGDAHPSKEPWMTLRARMEPSYEAFAATLKAQNVMVPSLRPTNYTRNLFHLLCALLSLAFVEVVPTLTSYGFHLVAAIAIAAALSGWSMELGRKLSAKVNAFLMWAFRFVSHPHEAYHINSATWYVSALALLSLTGSSMLCALALTVLGFADPAAALIGKRFGRIRLQNGRSLEGCAAFVLVGTLASFIMLCLLHPALSLPHALLVAFVASLCGGLTELWITRVDDNLAIPLAAGLSAWGVMAMLGVPIL